MRLFKVIVRRDPSQADRAQSLYLGGEHKSSPRLDFTDRQRHAV
jgi:hypothetical protein